jgi:hypothetical protein
MLQIKTYSFGTDCKRNCKHGNAYTYSALDRITEWDSPATTNVCISANMKWKVVCYMTQKLSLNRDLKAIHWEWYKENII